MKVPYCVVWSNWELRCLSTQVCDTETCGVVLTDTNKTSYYTLVLFCSHVPRIPLRSPLASPILSLTGRTLVLVLLLLNTNRKPCYHTLKVHPEGWLSSQVPDFRSFPQQQHWFVTKNTDTQIYSCINTCPQNVTIRNKSGTFLTTHFLNH